MKKIITAVLLVILISACDQLKVENQINDKESEVAELKSKNNHLLNEVKDLSSHVSYLNASQPGGAAVEELRKALTQKESELEVKEARYIREAEALRQMKVKIADMQFKFYSETGDKLEQVGAARQIEKEYNHMQEELDVANNRANNWLIFISVLGICVFVCIMSLLYTGLKYSRQRQDIDTALRFVEDGEMSNQDKLLMASYFGKRLGNSK